MAHLGEVMVGHEVDAFAHAAEDLEAQVVVVADAEQLAHEEQLTDHVRQVQELACCIQDKQVVALVLA